MTSLLSNLADLFKYHEGAPMLFNSGAFLVLFIGFIIGYALIYKKVTARLAYVVAFSLFFYYKSSGWYLIILVFSVVLDYFVAFIIHGAESKAKRKLWLIISVGANVGLLCYFKYTNFFIENLNYAGAGLRPLDIFLPIGISFYTFQTLSYIIDVYHGKIKPVNSLLDYSFYMTFFPHLVAGPIVRARDFLPQVRQDIHFEKSDLNEGFLLIVKGLIKKTLIADYLVQYNDLVFANPEGYSGFENLMAMYAYALQIYCDFSGYSDMAIGLAKWMGYQLGDNFRTPYASLSITEFWRRWHISLSSWLRDYIYIPLGGNRKGKFNQYLFLLITMLIGGLWHGPSWKFVVWGAMHGVGLIAHKQWIKIAGPPQSTLRKALGWFITFHYVAFLWIFFRAENFSLALAMIRQIFSGIDLAYLAPFIQVRGLLVFIFLAGFAAQFAPTALKRIIQTRIANFNMLSRVGLLLAVVLLWLSIREEGVQPFIYFQF